MAHPLQQGQQLRALGLAQARHGGGGDGAGLRLRRLLRRPGGGRGLQAQVAAVGRVGLGVEQAALERDAQATRTLFDEFNNRFKETGELEGITDADAVIDSYSPVPTFPSFPNTKLNLILGFMLGLALAGFVAVIMELLDNYMSSPEDVEQVSGVPFIGQIPLLPAAGNFTKAKVKPAEYLIDKPHSGFAEAYRHLRASIMFADIDKAAKTVAVVSSLPSEGKTSTDINMVLDIPVQLSVELGRTKVPIKYILQLAQGSVVELDALAGEPMDVLVNGYLIAQGEVVVVNDKFGIRLTDVVTPSERLRRVSRG